MTRLRILRGLLPVLLLALPAPGSRIGAGDLGGASFALPVSVPWEVAEGQLRVQLRAEGDPRAPGAVARQDLLGTRTVLVRTPEPGAAPIDVTVEQAASWGQAPDALFATGLANLERKQPPLFRQTPPLKNGVRVHLLYGEHPFAAAYALSVKHYPTCMGNKGALVAVPNRHATLCHPIESSRAFHAYLALVSIASDIQYEGDDPIVPHVYWFHDDVFEAQPVVIENDRHIVPTQTEAFRKLIDSLPRDLDDRRGRR